jgi:hypothetical protein
LVEKKNFLCTPLHMFGEFADGVGDSEPGDEPELPLLPGQAGVQAVHQAFYQGQYFATTDAVALLKSA